MVLKDKSSHGLLFLSIFPGSGQFAPVQYSLTSQRVTLSSMQPPVPPFLPGPVGPCLPSPPSETYVMLQPQYPHSLHSRFYQVPCVGSSLVIPHCLHCLSHIKFCCPYSRYQQFTYTKEITNPGLQPQVLGMGLVLSSHTWSLTWDLCASQSHQSL